MKQKGKDRIGHTCTCLALTYGVSPMGTLWTTWNESALAGGRFAAGLTGEHGADFDMRWPNEMWPGGPAK